MKLLLDTCIWGGAADALRMQGHDVVWSGDWDEDPGDEVILTTALAQGRVLIANPRRVVRFLTALASIRSTRSRLRARAMEGPGPRMTPEVLATHLRSDSAGGSGRGQWPWLSRPRPHSRPRRQTWSRINRLGLRLKHQQVDLPLCRQSWSGQDSGARRIRARRVSRARKSSRFCSLAS